MLVKAYLFFYCFLLCISAFIDLICSCINCDCVKLAYGFSGGACGGGAGGFALGGAGCESCGLCGGFGEAVITSSCFGARSSTLILVLGPFFLTGLSSILLGLFSQLAGCECLKFFLFIGF